uniref:(northern house mosquito) hypothetical protein n=1 Tax=Culex pipiens TaxID=7175 RepID=A0A8D7ZZL0_CULPI
MNPACRDTRRGIEPVLYRQRVPRHVPRLVSSEAPWLICRVHAMGECQTQNRRGEPRVSWCAGTMNQNTLGSCESGTGVNRTKQAQSKPEVQVNRVYRTVQGSLVYTFSFCLQ